MQLLEWSDAQVRFKIKEVENNVAINIDLDDYDNILLVIKFSTWKITEFIGTKWDESIVTFDIYSENTKWKSWSLTADIWWVKWVKRVRFNAKTIKWKILPSIKVPRNEWL